MTSFVYISKDKKEKFFKYKDEHPSIKCCDVYVDKESDRIYFVEKGLHGGAFELIHEDPILDKCKIINQI